MLLAIQCKIGGNVAESVCKLFYFTEENKQPVIIFDLAGQRKMHCRCDYSTESLY